MFFSRKKIHTLSDEELILSYKRSKKSFYVGELYKRYAHHVFFICKKYLKTQDKAEDAAMQIFEKLLDKLQTHEVENFKAWLSTLSRNYCLTALAKEASSQKKLEAYFIEDFSFMEIDHNTGLSDNETPLQLLTEALNGLNEYQKECLSLFYLKEKSYKEITEITGYPDKKVKSYIQNGKRNLKLLLTEKLKSIA